jgi:DNA-binding transcriptional MerR regulator
LADEDGSSLRDRLSRQSEEALGRLASDLLENPLVNGAITKAFSAREKAASAQEAAMGALNLPSAADIERLTRRLRTVGTRLEGIEEALDRVQDGVDTLAARLETASRTSQPGLADRVAAIEGQLSKLVNEVGHVSDAIDARPAEVHREQERLAVDDAHHKPKAKAKAKPAARKKAAAKKRAAG